MPPPRLIAFRDQIATVEPMNQRVDYNMEAWRNRFPQDHDLMEVTEHHPTHLTRQDVVDIGGPAIDDNAHRRKFFLATMIWGYGWTGYGPYRTHLMLQTHNLDNMLQATFEEMAQGHICQAYDAFQVNWCGPSFFTKFFYFVGLLQNVRPMPLIFDSRVATTFKLLIDDLHLDFRHYGISRSEDGRWSPQRYAQGYLTYLQTISEWADELGCRPDALELFLFDPGHPFNNWHRG